MPVSTLELAIVLQDVGRDVVETVSETDPLLGAIVALLIFAIVALAGVIVYLFRQYAAASSAKDDQIKELNGFIRTTYSESIQVLSEMARVIDVLTSKTENLSDEVKEELGKFLTEMRTHISVMRNINDFMRKKDEP